MILADKTHGTRIVNRDHVDASLVAVEVEINSARYMVTYRKVTETRAGKVCSVADRTAWTFERCDGGPASRRPQDGGPDYIVTPDSCTCPDTQYRQPERGCKHRVAARKVGLDKLLPLESRPLPPDLDAQEGD